MKYGNIRAFQKHLIEAAPSHFASVYLVVASEDYERKEAVNILLDSISIRLPPSEYSCKKMDGSKHSIKDLLHELSSFNFFSKKRVVFFDSIDAFKKDNLALLEKYFSKPFKGVFLILSAATVNRGTRFYKQVEKAGVILDIEAKKPWEKEASLTVKVVDWFKSEKVEISQSVAQSIVKSTGNDQALLHQEMEKLLCYIGDRDEVTIQDLQDIGSGKNVQTAWQLGDALFAKRGDQALVISTQLLQQSEPVISLLRQMRSQFQTRLIAATAPPEEMQRRYPYLRGQMLQKQIQQARDYGAEECRNALLLIDQTELAAKSSSLSSELLLEKLIFNLVR